MAALNGDEGTTPGKSHSRATLIKFFLPSTLGVLLFLVPFNVDGATKVLLGVIADWINASAGAHMRTFCAFVFVTSALLTPLYSFGPVALRRRLPWLKTAFQAGLITTLMRIAGGVFCGLTFVGIGPEWIIGPDTGGTAYFSIAAIIFCLIGTGAMLMPLLTDYGFLEFVGTVLRRFFQRVFGLPGRSTIDALASWVGSSSIAVIVTSRQYEGGYYTAREASVIATNFSVVSVPFVFLTASVAGIPEFGGTLYGAMVLVGITCALITPRLPPLSRMADDYYAPVGKQIHEEVAAGVSTWAWARHEGLNRAARGPAPLAMLRSGFATVFDLFFTMMPVAMTIEFIALVTYYHTDVLHILTVPLVPLLELMAIPEASAAAPGLVIGFLDQFVPAVIAGGITSPVTSFVLAGLSVTQLIFMAETGVLIHRSKIPLPIRSLAAIFVIRTVIALPILVAIAHWRAA
ncbi:MAG: YjiH family protein [Proteobacteria bacterium]|nr:YjiH family protein [Pseudomonadota bacterium]